VHDWYQGWTMGGQNFLSKKLHHLPEKKHIYFEKNSSLPHLPVQRVMGMGATDAHRLVAVFFNLGSAHSSMAWVLKNPQIGNIFEYPGSAK